MAVCGKATEGLVVEDAEVLTAAPVCILFLAWARGRRLADYSLPGGRM
jgi:hypothetical protein